MNVNALQNNPDWRWYIVFGAASLFLTYALWKVSDQVSYWLSWNSTSLPQSTIALFFCSLPFASLLYRANALAEHPIITDMV